MSQAAQIIEAGNDNEAKASEKERELRLLVKKHGRVDEKNILKLSELILEKMKTAEVLKVIDTQTMEFDISLSGSSNGR